ncbi:MAG: hypothetical protein R3C05_12900 [Pirellulaceae bacterium]
MSDTQNILSCPKCEAPVRAGRELAGSRVRCPRCGNTFKVPGIVATQNDDDDWLTLSEPLDRTKPKPRKSEPSSSPTASREAASTPNPKPAQSTRPAGDDETDDVEVVDDDSSDSSWLDDLPDMAPVSPKVSSQHGSLDDIRLAELGFPDLKVSDLDGLQLPESNRKDAGDANQGSEGKPGAEWLDFDDCLPQEVKPVEADEEFRFSCPICDTAHYARVGDVGKQVKCPDCTSKIVVPPAPKVLRPYKPPASSGGGFQLKDSVPRDERREALFTKSAEQLLREAEDTQIDDEIAALYENPDVAGWFREVFAGWSDPLLIFHFVVMGFLFTASIAAVYLLGNMNPAIVASVGGTAFVVCGVLLGSVCMSIVRSVAENEPNVKRWPMRNPFSAASSGIMAFVAFVLSAIPGGMLGALIGDPLSLFWGVFVMISVWILLPFILLSMLDNRSVFVPYSKDVVRSFEQCSEPWGGMYFSSGLFFFAYFMLLLAPPGMGIVKAFVASAGLVALAFTYARMIGKVAYAIGQPVDQKKKPS